MNLDKAKKRIAKQVSKGFKGYPLVTISYFGQSSELATDVVIQFIAQPDAEPQEQRFCAQTDIRNDEAIQTVILKIIERANAVSVTQSEGVNVA